MQTVAASVILEDAYRMIGWDPDQLETRQKQMARNGLSLALQEMWDRWWWEALMQSVPSQFAGTFDYGWSGFDAYETGHPVYFPATDWHYLALWPAGPPALLPGESYATYDFNNGLPTWNVPVTAITENFYGWARYNACLTPPAIWDPAGNPSLGDQCLWEGNIFQWIVNQGALSNNQPNPALVWNPAAPIANPGWMLVAPWQPTLPYDAQTPNYNSPPNYLSSLVGPFGELRGVCRLDPRATPNGGRYETREADNASGRVVLGLDMGRPWIYARRVTPVLTGDDYNAALAYDATAPADLVFDY